MGPPFLSQRITQDMAYPQSLMKYAEKCGVSCASRNPNLGLIELWHRLRQRGDPRRPESLFRVMRKPGIYPDEKKKKADIPKTYEQMPYPGQRIQVDGKAAPRRYMTDAELRPFQYTAMDEFSRLRFLAACPEQSTCSSANF